IGITVARGHDLRLAVKEIMARRVLLIEAHVTGGFFQRRDADARVLQELGGDVGNILAREMRAAQLRDRIVAVTDQNAFVKRSSFLDRDAVITGGLLAAEQILQRQIGSAEKLVEKSPPQAFRRTAVTREQRAGNLLGQLETESRAIEIGKKPR